MAGKILLMSSGLDSYIAWHFLGKPKCLHIAGHSRYSDRELYSVQLIKNHNPEMNLKIIYGYEWLREFEEPDGNIPMRNAYFAMTASHYGDTVYLPCQLGEQSIPDRSPEFFRAISEMVSNLAGRKLAIDSVFPAMTKMDMVRWYIDKGLPVEKLYDTYSCFSGEEARCGRCAACFRTIIALDYNLVPIPDGFFRTDIWKWEGIRGYIDRLKSGHYEQRRTEQYLEVLKRRGLM